MNRPHAAYPQSGKCRVWPPEREATIRLPSQPFGSSGVPGACTAGHPIPVGLSAGPTGYR